MHDVCVSTEFDAKQCSKCNAMYQVQCNALSARQRNAMHKHTFAQSGTKESSGPCALSVLLSLLRTAQDMLHDVLRASLVLS